MSLRSLRTIKTLFPYFLGFCIAHIAVSYAIYLLNFRMPLALKPVFSFAMQFVGIAFICSVVCLTAYAIKFAIDIYNSTKELDYLHKQLPKILRAQDVPENILSSQVIYTNNNVSNAQINVANNQLLNKVAEEYNLVKSDNLNINEHSLNNQSVELINTRNNKIKNFILAEFNGKLTALQVNSLMQQTHFRFLVESFIDIYTNRNIDLRKFMSDNDISINKLFDGISSEVIYKILSKNRPNLLNLINCFNRSSLNNRFVFRDAFAKLPSEQRIEILKDEVNGLVCNDSDTQSPIMEFINKHRQQLDLNLPDNVIVMNASNVAMSFASAGNSEHNAEVVNFDNSGSNSAIDVASISNSEHNAEIINSGNIDLKSVIYAGNTSNITNDLDSHSQRSSSLSSSNESQNSNVDQSKTNNTDVAQSLSRISSSGDGSISISDSSQESESKANEVKKSNSSEQPSSQSESKANEVKESNSSEQPSSQSESKANEVKESDSSKKSKIKSDETTKSSSSKDSASNKHHNKKRKNRFSMKDAIEKGNYYSISGRF